MTLEQRVVLLERDVENLKKQVNYKDEQITRLELLIQTRINEFSAYIDTTGLNARGTFQ